MINTVETYLDLVTSEHRDKPNFISTITALVGVPVQVQSLMTQMQNQLFDVDFAVGAQLDIIGEWAGVSRNVDVPITGVYLTWDDVRGDGWDYGIWQGPFDPSSGVTKMPDDIYRQIIRGKIAANHWDGTIESAYIVWNLAFPTIPMVMQDNQDMTMFMGLPGAPLNSLMKTLILQGYIPLKPEGVGITYYFTTVTAPLFGWDIENSDVSGWDTGAWGSTS